MLKTQIVKRRQNCVAQNRRDVKNKVPQKSFFILSFYVAGWQKQLKLCFSKVVIKTRKCIFLQTMHFRAHCLFWFLGWLKKWVLLTVFLESYVAKNTVFIVFSAKHSNCGKIYVEKQKIYETLWVVFTWQNMAQRRFC